MFKSVLSLTLAAALGTASFGQTTPVSYTHLTLPTKLEV